MIAVLVAVAVSAASLHSRQTAGKPLLGAVHGLKRGSSPEGVLRSAVLPHSCPNCGRASAEGRVQPSPLKRGADSLTPDCGRASAARLRHVLRLTGGSSPLGIGLKIMRLFFDGWTQDKAPLNPIMVFLAFGSWWDSRRFQNETRAEFKKISAEFKKTRKYIDTKIDPLVKEKNTRLLSGATAYLKPDRDPARINCFCIHVVMPEGLPLLKSSQFVVNVDFSHLNPTGPQTLRLMYSNDLVGQKSWGLDIPEGLAVDLVEFGNAGWAFEVDDGRIALLTLRWPFITKGSGGNSPPSTTLHRGRGPVLGGEPPAAPETSAPPPAQTPSSDGAPHQSEDAPSDQTDRS